MQNGSHDARKPDSAAMANQNNTSSLTMNQGTKVYNDDHSLTIGNRGKLTRLSSEIIMRCISVHLTFALYS